eukprot:3423604-Karenia_brevis.AAC.1
MAMWEAGHFAELLTRIEWQRMSNHVATRCSGGAGRRSRAQHQVRHGAYRKAVSSLSTSVAAF